MHDLILIIISIKQIYKNVLHIGFYHFPELWVIAKIAKICNRKKNGKNFDDWFTVFRVLWVVRQKLLLFFQHWYRGSFTLIVPKEKKVKVDINTIEVFFLV